MAATKSLDTIIAAGTTNTSGSTTTGTAANLSTKYSTSITGLLTNGGTGPTTAPVFYVEVSGDNVNWKQYYQIAGDTTASSITPVSCDISPGFAYGRVRVTGNTGQSITCEAFAHSLATI